jgi:hypothetical protein
MKTFRVYATYVVEVYCDIEAESKDDAWDKVYTLDGGDYSSPLELDWKIDRIEEKQYETI